MNGKEKRRVEGGSKACDFTLIELLVVIAIIGILAAMLMPALGRARTAAQRTVSVSNVRQLATIMQYYASDYGDSLPFARYYTGGWDSPANSWSRNLADNLDYIPGPSHSPETILWSPARNVIIDDGANTRRANPGYGLASAVTGSEPSYVEAVEEGRDPGTSKPLRLGQGEAPPAWAMVLLAEGRNKEDRGDTWHRLYGKQSIGPVEPHRYSWSRSGLYNYDGGIVRAYVDGRAHASADNVQEDQRKPDPNALYWDVDSDHEEVNFTEGPYAGIWNFSSHVWIRYLPPWFIWWNSTRDDAHPWRMQWD